MGWVAAEIAGIALLIVSSRMIDRASRLAARSAAASGSVSTVSALMVFGSLSSTSIWQCFWSDDVGVAAAQNLVVT
jgi:hypothetical protein